MPSSRRQRLILSAGAGALFVLLSSGFEFSPFDAKAPAAAPQAQLALQTAVPNPLAAPVGVQSFMDKMAAQR